MASPPSSTSPNLHVFFFPFLAHGHMIGLVDVAKLFIERGVRATIVTTPANASAVRRTVDGVVRAGHPINLLLIPFPSTDVGLPLGCEDAASASALNNVDLPAGYEDAATSSSVNSGIVRFYIAVSLLEQPFRRLLLDHHPDCLVSDTIYHWTSGLAREVGIPRIVYHGTAAFTLSVCDQFELNYGPNLNDSVDGEVLAAPGDLPHRVELTKPELPLIFSYPESLKAFREAETMSYGAVLNTFYELESAYVDKCKAVGRRRVCCVGPVHLCNRTDADMASRAGASEAHGVEDIKKWLDSMDHESVLYVCFGSGYEFGGDQLREIAAGVEASGRPFVWVVRAGGGGAETMSEWMPKGFEEKTEGRGLIVRGWAPQVVILSHPAVGGFLSHAGWNSVVEAVGAGVPMAVWPLNSDHFLIERLVVDVAEVGVRVLEGEWRAAVLAGKEVVRGEAVSRAVDRVMGSGEEARAVRERSKGYGCIARSAVEVGGSSYVNLSRLIEELTLMAEEGTTKTNTKGEAE